MSEERYPSDIAVELMDEIECVGDPSTSRANFEFELRDALDTLAEGDQLDVSVDEAILAWQLVEYLKHNKLDDKFRL